MSIKEIASLKCFLGLCIILVCCYMWFGWVVVLFLVGSWVVAEGVIDYNEEKEKSMKNILVDKVPDGVDDITKK